MSRTEGGVRRSSRWMGWSRYLGWRSRRFEVSEGWGNQRDEIVRGQVEDEVYREIIDVRLHVDL